jgi:CopG family transcriptional regulator, nickel-responsive regulator
MEAILQRITITIDDALLNAVDGLMRRRGYASRSEAFRDILRDLMDRDDAARPEAPCVGTLTYVYDHATRALSERLAHAQHDRHDLSVASLHVHLDHEACLEVAVLRGPVGAVRGFADTLTTQRGVRHASLHVVPVVESEQEHAHGGPPHRHIRA